MSELPHWLQVTIGTSVAMCVIGVLLMILPVISWFEEKKERRWREQMALHHQGKAPLPQKPRSMWGNGTGMNN